MKKNVLLSCCAAALLLTASAGSVRFVNLHYLEGTVYVAISDGGDANVMKAAPVLSDTVVVDVDWSLFPSTKPVVRAFQDLNDNRRLDFDAFGRPAEPCVESVVDIDESVDDIDVELIEY